MSTYFDMLCEEGFIERTQIPEEHRILSNTPEPSGRVVYPENWQLPTDNYMYQNYDMVYIRYTPYKRISHFREHLNRLQYCQMVYVPPHVIDCAMQCLQHYTTLPLNCYDILKDCLKHRGYSKYNEHIHYLISCYDKEYLSISYRDRHLMCTAFIQMDHHFRQTGQRKNILSYYLTVQLLLYLFHYHPRYALPSIKDVSKRTEYYMCLIDLLKAIPLFDTLMTTFHQRKLSCTMCHTSCYMFDRELVILLHLL